MSDEKGVAFKDIEDRVDTVLCAYLRLTLRNCELILLGVKGATIRRMTSADLSKRGFKAWLRFNRSNGAPLTAALPALPAVYCIRCVAERFTLSKGSSDILYIGSATNAGGLRRRVRQYLHPGPTQRTNQRILTRCGQSEDYEFGFCQCESGTAAKEMEATLLSTFLQEHLQLPPENRQLPLALAKKLDSL